jgi:hypothetical protein
VVVVVVGVSGGEQRYRRRRRRRCEACNALPTATIETIAVRHPKPQPLPTIVSTHHEYGGGATLVSKKFHEAMEGCGPHRMWY